MKHAQAFRWLGALALACASSLSAVAAGRPSALSPPANAAGKPVRDAQGKPINYGRAEWKPGPIVAATPPARGQGASSSWQFAAFGSGIGQSGLLFAINQGRPEVYAGGTPVTFGSDNYWYALQYAGDGSATQTFVSDLTPSPIVRIALARTGPGGVPHIVVALADGTVQQYDQQSKKLLSSQAGDCASRGGLTAFNTGDMDGDGVDELLSICQDQTLVVSGPNYAKWSVAGVGGTDVLAANLDDDPAIEIASSSGKVIDGATHAVQWNWPAGFGPHLRTAPVGIAKGYVGLIAASSWYVVTAFDVGAQVPLWTISTPQDIGAIEVGDVDGDGTPELLIGDGQWGAVKAYDLTTRALKGQIANPEHGVTNILVADVTGDGVPDLLWGAGATSTGPDRLYTARWSDHTIIWQNVDLVGPFLGPLVGDLDGDGHPELVFVSSFSDAGYSSGRIIVVDGRTLAVRAISPPVMNNFAWTGLHDIKLRDLQGNGRMSILLAADYLYDGQLEAWNFARDGSFTRIWTNASRPSFQSFYSVEVADVDGDGHPEVIGGGAYNVFVYDGATGALKSQSLQLPGNSVVGLAVDDFDGDGALEVVAQSHNGYQYVFDAKTLAVKAVVFGPNNALRAFHPQGSLPHLMLGGTDGRVSDYLYDGSAYTEQSWWAAGTAPITGLAQGPSGNWWVGSNGVLGRYRGGKLVYSTANYGTGMGRDVAFLPKKRLVLSGGVYGVFGFKVASP